MREEARGRGRVDGGRVDGKRVDGGRVNGGRVEVALGERRVEKGRVGIERVGRARVKKDTLGTNASGKETRRLVGDGCGTESRKMSSCEVLLSRFKTPPLFRVINKTRCTFSGGHWRD